MNPKCGSPSEPRDLTKMHAQSTIGQIAMEKSSVLLQGRPKRTMPKKAIAE